MSPHFTGTRPFGTSAQVFLLVRLSLWNKIGQPSWIVNCDHLIGKIDLQLAELGVNPCTASW